MSFLLLTVLGLAGALTSIDQAPQRPDFSGTWVFDGVESSSHLSASLIKSAGPVLGEECTITQTADVITMKILIGGQTITAQYRLDGSESRNVSPAPPGQAGIPIVSRTRWNRATLEVVTTSTSTINGLQVPVESVRRLWLRGDGALVIERSGTPADVVPPQAGVYSRKKGNQTLRSPV